MGREPRIKQIQTAHNYVVAQVLPNKEKVTGRYGVVVPERPNAFTVTGRVVGLGPMCRLKDLRIGDTILFPPYGAGERHILEGKEMVFLLDWEILGNFPLDTDREI